MLDTLLRWVAEGEAYLLLLPAYVLLIVGERIAHAFLSDRPWNNPDAAANISITLVFLGLDVSLGWLFPMALLDWIHTHAGLFTLGLDPLSWLAAFLLFDLTWYVDHRIGHRVGLFWALHQVHHSSPEYNMTVASRGFVLDNTLLPRPLFYALGIFGVTPLHYLLVKVVTSVWGIAQHTRLVGRLGWLDAVFATPSNHRVHHGVEPVYIDRNYGEVLIVWDRLLGTWQPEVEEPTYGVTTPIETCNPLRIEVAGLRWLGARLRRARGWRARVACLLRPPEWEP